jgi:hypothetical protein
MEGMQRMGMRTGLFAALLAVLPVAAAAQGLADYDYENLSFRGIGVDWGYIWPNKADATSMYSLRVDLGFLGPAIRIVPGVHYWSSSMKRSEVDRVAERLSNLPALQASGVIIDGDDLGNIRRASLGTRRRARSGSPSTARKAATSSTSSRKARTTAGP